MSFNRSSGDGSFPADRFPAPVSERNAKASPQNLTNALSGENSRDVMLFDPVSPRPVAGTRRDAVQGRSPRTLLPGLSQQRLRPLDALDVAAGRARPAGAPAMEPRERVSLDQFEELDVSLDSETGLYWCRMNPLERPSYTRGLLRGIAQMQHSLRDLFAAYPTRPFDYWVLCSQFEGVFNLGGDLALFARLIRDGDRDGLLNYATLCIDVVYANYINHDLPITTIGLVQGDALGGGFEAALSCDVIVAEKGVKFGFPEVLFNLFPGMGAYSLLARKLGGAKAHQMIMDGRVYDAQELHAMGLVHELAEPGAGEDAVRDFARRDRRRRNATVAMHAALRKTAPLPYSELLDIVTLWVDSAMQLSSTDLRKMERLIGAQDRRTRDASAAPCETGAAIDRHAV
ncbi:MAG: enoyl-CoA hydratase [Salinarimonadaceae bacterium]|nr:MAG: enoyl-CoA hydratase [Salinarimonadaceae bacterium]